MTFFVDSIVLEEKDLKYINNYKSDRYLFRLFNNKDRRPEGHAANGILRDEEASPYAIHCNCGYYHPVCFSNSKHEVDWSPSFTVKTKNSNEVKKIIKGIWIRQL